MAWHEYIFAPRYRKKRVPRPRRVPPPQREARLPTGRVLEFLESLHRGELRLHVWCDEGLGAVIRVRVYDVATGKRVPTGFGRPNIRRYRRRQWISPTTEPTYTSKADRLVGVSMCVYGVTDDGCAACDRKRARLST